MWFSLWIVLSKDVVVLHMKYNIIIVRIMTYFYNIHDVVTSQVIAIPF